MHHILPFLPKPPSQWVMFNRSKPPPANGFANRVGDNPYATNAPGQRGAVQGFVLSKWLRLHLADLITMAIMGAMGLGVYYARKSVFGTSRMR